MNNQDDLKKGSITGFDRSWQTRKEATYNHWTSGRPKNQIQLAFQNHWTLFRDYLQQEGIHSGRCLEVGCGRGTLSSYFAQNGYDCTLLDSSKKVLDTAKSIFARNGHDANYIQGDANQLPFLSGQFDVLFSIGLLEHFEHVSLTIHEQIRVLKPGGRFFGYIVPERPDNIQKYYSWINQILKTSARICGRSGKVMQKEEIYRSDFGSEHYINALKDQPVNQVEAYGMYPLPMISHSPEFPFSLLPKPVEWVLARVFESVLATRKILFRRHPWKCREELGQAFLVTFRKA